MIKSTEATFHSLGRFRKSGDKLGFGETYMQLALAVGLSFNLDWSMKRRLTLLNQMISLGEEAVDRFSSVGSEEDQARAHVITGGYMSLLAYYSDGQVRERLYPKCDYHLRKALQASEKAALVELATQSKYAMTYIGGAPASDRGIATLEKSLEYAKETRDRFVISSALEFLAYNLHLKSTIIEDPEEREILAQRWMLLTEEAFETCSPVTVGKLRQSMFFVVPPYASYHVFRAEYALSEDERRSELAQAKTLVEHALELSEEAGVPEGIFLGHYSASKIYAHTATMEDEPTPKLRDLKTSALHAKRALSIISQGFPVLNWERGGLLNSLADIELNRALLDTNPKQKTRRFLKAIKLKEKILTLRNKTLTQTSDAVSTGFGYQGLENLNLGDIYLKLYSIRRKPADLRRAEQKFLSAADLLQKTNQRTRVAEAYWKTATTLDKLSDHVRSSEYYSLASNNYNIGGQRIPSLRKFYEEMAFNMQARSEIELAKNHHLRREYSEAKECYQRAASLYASFPTWHYLATYYSAWANMENAEEHARRHQPRDAIQFFEEAIQLFKETVRSLQSQIPLMNGAAEQETARTAIADSEDREKLAKARITIEKARIAIKVGDLDTCWNLCAAAINTLKELQPRLIDRDEAGREVSFLIEVCQACQVVTKAETDSTIESYREAADQFESWKTHTSEKQSITLITAHGHFYRALELGVEYGQTGKSKFYSNAKGRCEKAADYYQRAGFPVDSEKARGTALLFDSYLYRHKASSTDDPSKQARLYDAAEKLLATSSDIFGKAGLSEKQKQVVALLERTRKDREIAVSLAELLARPGLVILPDPPRSAGPPSIVSPGPEKFANAFLQAELSMTRDVVSLGDDVELRLTIANAGNAPAVLLRIEGLIPAGFEPRTIPDLTKLESGDLILRERRLAPLKSEEFRLVLRPRVVKDFDLRPNLVYLDENGRRFSRILGPFQISVKQKSGEGEVRTSMALSSTEFFVSEGFRCTIEILTEGPRPIVLRAIENCAPESLEISKCEGGVFESKGNRVDLRGLRFEPGEAHTVRLEMLTKADGRVKLEPSLLLGENPSTARNEKIQSVEITIHRITPILRFLADAYATDDSIKRLSTEQSGWRTLLNIASSLKIPRSQVYGERRYGHAFGKPIESLLREGMIEYRTFPGKGRGGNITKVRIVHERDAVRRLIDGLRSNMTD